MGDLEWTVEGGHGEVVGVLVPCDDPPRGREQLLEQAGASEGGEGEDSDPSRETEVECGLEGRRGSRRIP